MIDGDSVVATYSSHAEAEDAVKILHLSGFDITKLSIIYDCCRIKEHVVGFYTEDQRLRAWGKGGVLFGSTLGVLAGAALFYAPLTVELVTKWSALVLAAGLVFGGLSTTGALVYGRLLTAATRFKYEFTEQGEEQFALAADDKGLASEARTIILRSDSLVVRLQRGDATDRVTISSVPSEVALSPSERGDSRKESEGIKV